MDKGALGIHQVKLVVQAREDFCHSSRVGDHAHGALHFGKVASWHYSGWLVVDTALETSGAPVHKLDGPAPQHSLQTGFHYLSSKAESRLAEDAAFL